jgi:glycosyltransferase involved in cell wall biosynthesis
MKIAVFDQVGNWGGGSRFARALLLFLKSEYPAIKIDFFGNHASLIRENMQDEFLNAGIGVNYLASTISKNHGLLYHMVRAITNKINSMLGLFSFWFPDNEVCKEIENLAKGYDIAFFPWPYFMECPHLECPAVGVFHDFNYRYFFGGRIFSEKQYHLLNLQLREWISRVKPVVSSRFIAAELTKFYPDGADRLEIVHLAPFDISDLSPFEARNIIEEMGIKTPYILYPTNLCYHKNIGVLLRAMYLLRGKNVSVPLIITGPGTECAAGKISEYGVEREVLDPDIFGLGYVSNLQMDALVQCAKVVVSTSLYEAGNGPGLEAWRRGVPVIMSDIPAFLEHVEVLGVKAMLVDPYNAHDVARGIYAVLSNYKKAIQEAELSRENLSKHTWKKVAGQYYKIFENLVHTPAIAV